MKKIFIFFMLQTIFFFGTPLRSMAESYSLAKDDRPFVMGALGDSITTAMNATFWGSHRRYSWATGTENDQKVESHYQKLIKTLNRTVERINVARPGARSSDLDEQIKRLLAKKIDYVTLLMGANDVCSWDTYYLKSLSRFEEHITKAVEQLIHHNEHIKILMVPIPNMVNLREVGLKNGCQWRWDLFGICPNLLSSSSTAEDRNLFAKQLGEANKILQKIALSHPHNINYNHSLSQYKFQWKAISKLDCFHPSIEGQNIISNLTWQKNWSVPPLFAEAND